MGVFTSEASLISSIIRMLIIIIIPIFLLYFISLLNKYVKEINREIENYRYTKQEKMLEMIIQTVVNSVCQTYLDDIYRQNSKITEEEELIAYNMIKEKSIKIISEAAAVELADKYNNLDKWLENKIYYYLSIEISSLQSSDGCNGEVFA
ncbi:hypothetical protein F8154_07740 [Alkaliphilus pronyensis]|uniref:Uncharacterized protein n=1 Tax=Alkaliphilus pronyensis TaxID=1482732 RepID=A0A6I0FBJ9_9FIRM|nr:hypothetical protein [Alkaliphilus pronyensis]KAB3534870.1 hypothetical protein F8154_07740 [Alkaliphilus pronyensis]